MTPPTVSNRKTRDRAKVVCVHCHARKVRCDLQERECGVCSNCERRGQQCQRHNDRASRATRSRALPPVNARPVSVASNTRDDTREGFSTGPSSLGASSQLHSASPQYIRSPLDQSGYIGEQSLMSFSSSAPTYAMINTGSFPEHIHNEILRATNATSLPPTSRVKVFADTYFQHLYHVAPVIDRADLASQRTSILLQQAICLIGSQLRYPREQSPTLLSESYYLKIKTLIYTNHEPDNFTLLKALCILCFWIVTPPVVVSLDSSYHWLGVAVRLACQMGLHRESSYLKLSNTRVARRIIWFLFAADKLQAAAFGRPVFLLSQSMDVSPLQIEHFETADTSAEIFIECMKLNMVLERILEFQDRNTEASQEKVSGILGSLEQWLAHLPNHLRLYDLSGGRDYRRAISEMHIHYFTRIILLVHLYEPHISPYMMPISSVVASSCMACLYQEIDDHDEINYLTPIHNWSLMVGCIPQIYRLITFPEEHHQCNTDLDTFVTALKCMSLKWPPANNILRTIDRLRTAKSHPRTSTSVEREQSAYSLPTPDGFPAPILTNLFPFPKDMCPRMALVSSDSGGDTLIESTMTPTAKCTMDWIFDEFDLDHLNMPFVG